ncbi:MAG TPA: diaminopimelate decarboxylase [Allosphingosinicella sp.]|jgi:diaminopimelate decarboxylase|nr:diaminopimelate decarboxylase [Allosphingosinicella sp.]
MDPFHLQSGAIHCEDVPLERIAREVGTPAYVYSTAGMQRQARALKAALAPLGDPLIAFAVKANPNKAVLATLAAEGLGADVVSGGEYQRARAAGIAAEKIVFSGVGKTEAEMRLALKGGLCQFNLESVPEADMLSQVARSMGRTAPVGFRVNPDVAAGSHAKISTGAAHNKFGISIDDALQAYARARALPGLEIGGVAVHIGSQLTSLAPLEAAFEKIGALIRILRADGHEIRTADLGGGLGVAYDPAAPAPPAPEDYGAMVSRVAGDWGVRLIFEPGRLVTGNAGVLLARVIRVKPGPDHPFVILDAAMNDLLRPSLYDAWHGIEAVVPAGGRMIADIVGPICETGDTFALARSIDRVAEGELMIIRTAGAYAATMASTYNSRPLPPEVLVNGDQWALVRERQEIEALMEAERMPAWLGR